MSNMNSFSVECMLLIGTVRLQIGSANYHHASYSKGMYVDAKGCKLVKEEWYMRKGNISKSSGPRMLDY